MTPLDHAEQTFLNLFPHNVVHPMSLSILASAASEA
jgi:hypothetical protein